MEFIVNRAFGVNMALKNQNNGNDSHFKHHVYAMSHLRCLS